MVTESQTQAPIVGAAYVEVVAQEILIEGCVEGLVVARLVVV